MKPRELLIVVVGLVILFLATSGVRGEGNVEVSVGISLPAHTFAAPPPVVVIPGTYAYFVPTVDFDIVFYRGYWYRPHEGRWYRAKAYNGPWTYLAPKRVPRALIELPPDYRHDYASHRHIPYGEYHKNWKKWERDRYWESDEGWRRGRYGEPHGEHRHQ